MDHLVEELSVKGKLTKLAFDYVRANAEIGARGGLADAGVGWEERSPTAEDGRAWEGGGRGAYDDGHSTCGVPG